MLNLGVMASTTCHLPKQCVMSSIQVISLKKVELPVQVSLPHSAAATAPGDAASAATLVQQSMPPSAVAQHATQHSMPHTGQI
nr:hypothetical protein CFP56_40732 [Quercus suber]